MIKRDKELAEVNVLFERHRVVGVVGARQVAKSTMVTELLQAVPPVPAAPTPVPLRLPVGYLLPRGGFRFFAAIPLHAESPHDHRSRLHWKDQAFRGAGQAQETVPLVKFARLFILGLHHNQRGPDFTGLPDTAGDGVHQQRAAQSGKCRTARQSPDQNGGNQGIPCQLLGRVGGQGIEFHRKGGERE